MTKSYNLYSIGCFIPLIDIYKYFGNSIIMESKFAKYNIILSSKFGDKTFNPIIRNKQRILIPRWVAHEWVSEGIINLIVRINDGDKLKIDGKIEAMKHQEILEQRIINDYFNEKNTTIGKAGCVVKLATGLGKTHLGSIILQKLGIRTCIVVPNIKLAIQWEDRFQTVFPDLKVGCYHSRKKIWGDVIIIVGKSVLSDVYTFTHKHSSIGLKKIKGNFAIPYTDFWPKFGLTIFDEAHTYCTDEYRGIFMRASTLRVLGLTATPDYGKYTKLLDYYLGPTLDGDEIEEVADVIVDFTKIYTPVFYTPPNTSPEGEEIFDDKTGKDLAYGIMTTERFGNDSLDWSKTISNILSDPYRLEAIVQLIVEKYNNNDNIFVFVDRKQILPLYKTRLRELGLRKIYTLIAETSEETQRIMEKKARVVLGTYQACGTGISIDHMTCIVLASPRKEKFKQIMGRILRIKSDASKPRTIIDFVDSAITFQYKARKTAFIDQFGAKLKNPRKISYSDYPEIEHKKLKFNYI